VQCELARLDPSSPRYPELQSAGQLDLLAEHEHAWLGECRSVWCAGVPARLPAHGNDHAGSVLDHVRISSRVIPSSRVAFVNKFGESLPEDAVQAVAHRRLAHVRAIDARGAIRRARIRLCYGEIHTNAWLAALAKASTSCG